MCCLLPQQLWRTKYVRVFSGQALSCESTITPPTLDRTPMFRELFAIMFAAEQPTGIKYLRFSAANAASRKVNDDTAVVSWVQRKASAIQRGLQLVELNVGVAFQVNSSSRYHQRPQFLGREITIWRACSEKDAASNLQPDFRRKLDSGQLRFYGYSFR